MTDKLNFTDENIFLVSKLLGSNVSKMTPSYLSNLCATTGFLIFYIKDILEYAGVILDRKVNNLRVYKNMQFEEFKEKTNLEKIKYFLEIVHDKVEKSGAKIKI